MMKPRDHWFDDALRDSLLMPYAETVARRRQADESARMQLDYWADVADVELSGGWSIRRHIELRKSRDLYSVWYGLCVAHKRKLTETLWPELGHIRKYISARKRRAAAVDKAARIAEQMRQAKEDKEMRDRIRASRQQKCNLQILRDMRIAENRRIQLTRRARDMHVSQLSARALLPEETGLLLDEKFVPMMQQEGVPPRWREVESVVRQCCRVDRVDFKKTGKSSFAATVHGRASSGSPVCLYVDLEDA